MSFIGIMSVVSVIAFIVGGILILRQSNKNRRDL